MDAYRKTSGRRKSRNLLVLSFIYVPKINKYNASLATVMDANLMSRVQQSYGCTHLAYETDTLVIRVMVQVLSEYPSVKRTG